MTEPCSHIRTLWNLTQSTRCCMWNFTVFVCGSFITTSCLLFWPRKLGAGGSDIARGVKNVYSVTMHGENGPSPSVPELYQGARAMLKFPHYSGQLVWLQSWGAVYTMCCSAVSTLHFDPLLAMPLVDGDRRTEEKKAGGCRIVCCGSSKLIYFTVQ